MNIFVIDEDPYKAAMHMHDKHVVKMVLESAQLICTTRRLLGDDNPMLYKITHINHPCTIWARESVQNYLWLCRHFKALCEEYTYRYGRTHVCERFIPIMCDELKYPLNDWPLTTFRLAMPEKYKTDDPVQSYRNYYLGEKIQKKFWTKRRYELDDWLLSHLEEKQFRERKPYVNKRTHTSSSNLRKSRVVEEKRTSN